MLSLLLLPWPSAAPRASCLCQDRQSLTWWARQSGFSFARGTRQDCCWPLSFQCTVGQFGCTWAMPGCICWSTRLAGHGWSSVQVRFFSLNLEWHQDFVGSVYFLCITSGSALNDGQWHSVVLNSRKGRLTVTADVDEGGYAHARPPFLIVTGSQLFFGGTCDREEKTPHAGFLSLMPCLLFLRLSCWRERAGMSEPFPPLPGLHASFGCGQTISGFDQGAAEADGKLQWSTNWHVWHHWQVGSEGVTCSQSHTMRLLIYFIFLF